MLKWQSIYTRNGVRIENSHASLEFFGAFKCEGREWLTIDRQVSTLLYGLFNINKFRFPWSNVYVILSNRTEFYSSGLPQPSKDILDSPQLENLADGCDFRPRSYFFHRPWIYNMKYDFDFNAFKI